MPTVRKTGQTDHYTVTPDKKKSDIGCGGLVVITIAVLVLIKACGS